MNSFKFKVGDLLKVSGDGASIVSPGNLAKGYKDSRRVSFRFWDGKSNVYVVTAEDGIGLVVDEETVELQEAAVDAEEAPIDGREKNLYRIQNKIGEFYIVARSFDEAADELKDRLRKADYGFFQDRNVPRIEYLAAECFHNDKQLFCDREANLIITE